MGRIGWIVGLLAVGCQEYNVKTGVPADELPPETTPITSVELSPDDPALAITPQSYAFPTPCDDEVELTLENVGGSDLVIDALDYDASGDLALVDDLQLPVVLAPGETAPVWVSYEPDETGSAFGVLDVTSNDPRGVRSAEQAAEAGDAVVETFEVVADPPIDLLFALDKSCSMIEETRNLGQAFDQFISEIGQVTTDWRIGVAVKDSGCFERGVITEQTPNYQDVFLDATSGLLFGGTGLTEQLLELSHVALGKTGATACNAGFVRHDALMHVIAVSDEPEQSGQPWHHWVDQWAATKPDASLVMVSAVVDTNGACGSYGQEYVEAAQNTGGLVLDVCSSNWGSYAQQLGSASAAAVGTFLLAAIPDEGTLEVRFDGDLATEGQMWTYDAVRNAIVIEVELPDGTEVEVSYDSLGCDR